MTDRLAEDWVALWQSELNAMAADRELRESWLAMVALWGNSAQATLALMRSRHEQKGRAAGAVEPAGTAAAVAASQSRVDEIERLHRRIAELERRLAGDAGDRAPG